MNKKAIAYITVGAVATGLIACSSTTALSNAFDNGGGPLTPVTTPLSDRGAACPDASFGTSTPNASVQPLLNLQKSLNLTYRQIAAVNKLLLPDDSCRNDN